MIAVLAAAAAMPWSAPLRFRPLPGWRTGTSGTVASKYGPSSGPSPKESAAWVAKDVRYRDAATDDPPNRTLTRLPQSGVIVWALNFQGGRRERRPISPKVAHARHHACCEAVGLAAGEYELVGFGPRSAYTVYVRIYFGSRPTPAMRAEVQRALDRLQLPRPVR